MDARMPDALEDLDVDLAMCTRHLNETGNTKTRLGDIFPVFALGHICAEYQKYIRDAMTQGAKKSGDMQLARYVDLSLKRLGMGSDALQQNILAVFSDDISKNRACVPNAAWTAYRNLIKTRNKAMHGVDISEGLDDVIRMHRKAREVVHVIRTRLLGGREYDGVYRSATKYD